jgi:hypothetical protein
MNDGMNELAATTSTYSSFKSCHHGDSNHPNNLEYAKRVIDVNIDIDIVEIDFIMLNRSIISSHDYNPESIDISGGSPLREWIEYVVYKKRRFLWIDVKQNTWPLTSSSYFSDIKGKFNARLFMEELNKIRKHYISSSSLPYYHRNEVNVVNIDDYHENQRQRMKSLRKKDIPLQNDIDHSPFDIIDYILIGCQDRELLKELNDLNDDGKWQIIVDIPYVESYLYQYICIQSFSETFNDDKIKTDFLYERLNYDNVNWIAIDHSFFKSSNRLVYFITLLKEIYPYGRNIIIYNVDKYIHEIRKSFEPLSHLYTIIFQYDYDTIAVVAAATNDESDVLTNVKGM